MKALVIALVLPLALACGALTAQDRSELAVDTGEQDACVAATPHDRAAIDACRAKVKADWCASEAHRFDAGVCQ